MRRVLALLTLAALASACDSEPPIRISREDAQASGAGDAAPLRVVETLQCPQTEDVLTRRGGPAADGRSCEYNGPRGSQVTLRLIALDGSADTALAALDDEVRALLPEVIERVSGQVAPAGQDDEAVDIREPGVHVRSEGESATVRIPGISIDTDGQQANVRIGGFSISADDQSGHVDMGTDDESVRIRAQDDAAEIRTVRTGDGVRATYILVDERGTEAGWRLAGYEARGPGAGPLVVAVVRSRDRQQDDVFDAAKALVTRNVGE